jgi:hypothetical protein
VSRSVNIPTPNPATSVQLDNTGGRVIRVSLRELTGTAGAVLDVYDGTGTGGVLLDTISLSAGQSTRDYYRLHQYPYYGGLFLDVVSGSFKGTFTVAHSDHWATEGEPVLMVNPEVLSVTVTPS